MKQIPGQMSIFDWQPTLLNEPDVGTLIHGAGAVICHIMRNGYIGKKVAFDCGTESMPDLYKVGILEKYFWYEPEKCMRSVIWTGGNHRALINHKFGRNIYEPLPWDAYQDRMAAIGRN